MTVMPVEPRELSDGERALLVHLLRSATFSGAEQLAAQVVAARVTGGLPTLLDLEVARTVPPSAVTDGPAPLRAYVETSQGDVEGEVLVWVNDGYLSGLEFAWYTDQSPGRMPPPERVRVE
jgi:hypothetical protein